MVTFKPISPFYRRMPLEYSLLVYLSNSRQWWHPKSSQSQQHNLLGTAVIAWLDLGWTQAVTLETMVTFKPFSPSTTERLWSIHFWVYRSNSRQWWHPKSSQSQQHNPPVTAVIA